MMIYILALSRMWFKNSVRYEQKKVCFVPLY